MPMRYTKNGSTTGAENGILFYTQGTGTGQIPQ